MQVKLVNKKLGYFQKIYIDMIIIEEHGTKFHRITCKRCKCVFLYDYSEVQGKDTSRPHVYCPECDYEQKIEL